MNRDIVRLFLTWYVGQTVGALDMKFGYPWWVTIISLLGILIIFSDYHSHKYKVENNEH